VSGRSIRWPRRHIATAFRLWLADIDGKLDELLRERARPREASAARALER